MFNPILVATSYNAYVELVDFYALSSVKIDEKTVRMTCNDEDTMDVELTNPIPESFTESDDVSAYAIAHLKNENQLQPILKGINDIFMKDLKKVKPIKLNI